MNLITKTFENFDVRILIDKNGDPLFVAADVCKVLDISNPTDSIKRLDADETTLVSIEGSTGNGGEITRSVNAVTESGLYSLILGSRKPEAKAFKRWVTHEVIPSIRKTGSYSVTPQLTVEEMTVLVMTDLQNKIAEQKKQLAIAAPKAEYFDCLVDRKLNLCFRDTAKELHVKPGMFIDWLIENKYIYRDAKGQLKPRAEYSTTNGGSGLFELKEWNSKYSDKAGNQTLVTVKGRETFRLLFENMLHSEVGGNLHIVYAG